MIKNVLVVLIFSVCYQFIHVNYLYEYFDYMGYKNEGQYFLKTFIAILFILIPLLLASRIRGFLEIAYTFFYFLLYIPVIITFSNSYTELIELLPYFSIFLFSFLIIFIPSIYNNKKLLPLHNKTVNIKVLILLNILILLTLLFYFRNSLAIVNFESVYEHRSEVNINSSLISYFILWNTYLIGPLILIQGLLKNKKLLIFLGIISVISVYAMTSSKVSLFIPFSIIGVHWVLGKVKMFFSWCGMILAIFMLLMLSIAQKFFMLSAVILMRTFGVSGLLTYQYNEYFQSHPLTFLSHVNIVNYLTSWYPYKQSLGFVVSEFFGESYNANANFWATDGIASFGILGVLIVSLFLGLFFLFLKSIERESNYNILVLIIIPFCFMVLNVSLFTTIVSGGYLFFGFYYLFAVK